MGDALHRKLVQAIADPGAFTPRGDNYEESIPSWGARAVVIALDMKTVCSCCGLIEEDCKGLSYWGDGDHEYEPVIIIRPPVSGSSASTTEGVS